MCQVRSIAKFYVVRLRNLSSSLVVCFLHPSQLHVSNPIIVIFILTQTNPTAQSSKRKLWTFFRRYYAFLKPFRRLFVARILVSDHLWSRIIQHKIYGKPLLLAWLKYFLSFLKHIFYLKSHWDGFFGNLCRDLLKSSAEIYPQRLLFGVDTDGCNWSDV